MTRRAILGCVLLPLAAACGGGDPPTDTTDAGLGPPVGFLVSRIVVPQTSAEAIQVGVEVDELPGIDNQLGLLLSSLRTVGPAIDIGGATTAAIDRGELLLLLELQTRSLASGPAALRVGAGLDPTPSPCADVADTTCRRHLAGDGRCDLDPRAGVSTPLTGGITTGHFRGAGGIVRLSLAFPLVPPVLMTVRRAAAELDVSDGGITGGRLGGAIARNELAATFTPAMAASFAAQIARDCQPPRQPPSCGCLGGSAGLSAISLFDTDGNCTVSTGEVDRVASGLFTTDIDLDADGLPDALSIGLGLEAVRATYPPLP